MNQEKAISSETESEAFSHSFLDQVDLQPSEVREGLLLVEFTGLDASGQATIRYPGDQDNTIAESFVQLKQEQVGTQVAISHLVGSGKPVIHGPILNLPITAQMDDERMVLEAKREIELRCGKASILLKENGKVIIKGTEIVSRSKGANKIKGTSVAIN